MEELIVMLATKYPALVAIFSVIGVLRAINKPLFALLKSYVGATETKKDDEMLTAVEQSKAYKYLCFVLDYLTSVKLPQKK
jgi:hypothetical protein